MQAPDGAVRWAVDTPSVQQLRLTFVGPRPADSDSLDIPSLRDLPKWLELPLARWPKVDLQTSVEATPIRALPGDVVTFAIQIRNAGDRDVERAHVKLLLTVCCEDVERRYEWYPRIPAGHTAHIRFSATFPEGSGNALVTAYSFYPETNRERTVVEDNSALMWVFRATDPRELVVGPEISNPAGIKPQDR